MQEITVITGIIVLIMSVVIHEVSHGYAAYMLGDKTAAFAGRLTLNPLKHLDLIGSVLVPIVTYLGGGFIFGWAKPVPYNPYNLKNQKWGDAIVAAAGPLSNLSLALAFGLIIHFGLMYGFLVTSFVEIASIVVIINISLALFNLIPIPPLDGSKILFSFFPYALRGLQQTIERYSFILIIVFVLFLSSLLSPVVMALFSLITGLH